MAIVSANLVSQAQLGFVTIRGEVIDSLSRTPLEDATICLLSIPNRKLIQQIRNEKSGFELCRIIPGMYQLIVSYQGYLADTIAIDIISRATQLKTIYVQLEPLSQELVKIEVHARAAKVTIRNDTLGFNAKNYSSPLDASLEDLLRKMPGIEIDKDGNVLYQGEKIETIYVNGKYFSVRDIKTATQNLPADLVAQIEIFDSETEKAALLGIKDNKGTKSLNIVLKDNKNRGYFGDIYAGVSNTNQYSTGGRFSNLGTSSFLLGIINMNNINDQFTGIDNKDVSSGEGIQSHKSANFNFRKELGHRVNMTLNGELNDATSLLLQTDKRTTFLDDSSLQENHLTNSVTTTISKYLDSHLEYVIDSFNTLIYRGSYATQELSFASKDTGTINSIMSMEKYLIDRIQANNTSTTSGFSTDNSLDFSHKFPKKGRTFYLGLTKSFQKQQLPTGVYSNTQQYDSLGKTYRDSALNEQSEQSISGTNYSVTVGFTNTSVTNHIFDYSYQTSNTISISTKHAFDFDSLTRKFDIRDSSLSNNFTTQNVLQRLSIGYNVTENKIRYQLGIITQFDKLINTNSDLPHHSGQVSLIWFPRASLTYSLTSGKYFSLYYSGYSTAPNTDQLQPTPDPSNQFNIKVGNAKLQQQIDHTITLNYVNLNRSTSSNIQAYLRVNYTEHKISTETTLLAGGVQQMQYLNIEGNYHISGSFVYGFWISNGQKGNGSVSTYFQYTQDVSQVNYLPDVSRSWGGSENINLNYYPTKNLSIENLFSLTFTNIHNSVYPYQAVYGKVYLNSLYISYLTFFGLGISTIYKIQIASSQGAYQATQNQFLNVAVYKNIFPKKSIEVRMSAFGILNNAKTFTQTIAQNYIETLQSSIPEKMFLLSVTYHFSKLKTPL